MAKKPGRKSQRRAPKPPTLPKRQRVPLPELHNAPRKRRGRGGGTVTFTAITHQDSILPVKLKFPPPLSGLAVDPTSFDYIWQHMTYAFDLPDPSSFPRLSQPIEPKDLRKLKRFVEVCETAAGYSAVSHKGGITLSHAAGEDYKIEVNDVGDEARVGFSARFRQLHSLQGDPDFSTVSSIIGRYAASEVDHQAADRLSILKQWNRARAKLMNRPLQNIVCRKVLESEGYNSDYIDQQEMYGDVDPTEVINLFNYGELLHFGKYSDDYDELSTDSEKEDFRRHDFMVSMLGLVHLYFGYSLLIRAACGAVVQESVA